MLTEGDYTTTLVSHAYDAAGQKGLLSTAADYYGRTISYAYSARNELATVGEAAGTTTYAYDAAGNQSHLYLPNGVHTDQYYNNDGTLDSYYNRDSGSTIYQSYGYAYNADGQVTGFNEGTSSNVHGVANPTSTAYGYDGQGHLTSDSRTGSNPYSRAYTVDGVANRVALTLNGTAYGTVYYGADDELDGNGSLIYYYYDADGQPTYTLSGGGVRTDYAFDFDGQMTGLSKPGAATTFQYDALGRQTRRILNGTSTVYYYDGGSVLYESNADGSVETAQYTWGNGLIRRNGEYPLTDGRGSVRQETDGSRAITATLATDASGMTVGSSGSSGSAYGFHGGSGYRSDGDGPAGFAAFQKVGARYYDPMFGRFLTRDTDLSQRPYAYCDGDPVNCVDPTGHEAYKAPVTDQSASHDNLTGFMDEVEAGDAPDNTPAAGPMNLANELKGKGTFNGSYTQAGPITTITLGMGLQSGRTTISDMVTWVQSPTISKVTNSIGGGYMPGGIFGTTVFGVVFTSGTKGTPPSQSVTFKGTFSF